MVGGWRRKKYAALLAFCADVGGATVKTKVTHVSFIVMLPVMETSKMSAIKPFIDPARPKPRFRPLKAMGHMNKLLADKEDTQQVFHIIEALNGNALRRNFQRFLETSNGQARFAARRDLAPLMDNHAGFGTLAPDSVGRKYIDFMKREGLTAAGLVAESQTRTQDEETFEDDLAWFGNRLRDTHDIFHVLSGYGRDGLGEAALLVFSHGQNPGRGISFIANIGFRQMRKTIGREIDFKAVKEEARRNGKQAAKIVEQDILALMHEPIDEVRARLNIPKPVAYKRALEAFNALPADQRDMLTA